MPDDMHEAIARLNEATAAVRGASGRMGGVGDAAITQREMCAAHQKSMDERFESLHRQMDQRFLEIQRAVDKADRSMNERLLGMNEFRDTLRDQAARLPTREEVATQITPLAQELGILRLNVSAVEGKVIGRESLAQELKPIREAVEDFHTFRDTYRGKATQSSVFVSAGIAVLALFVAIVNVIIHWGTP